MTTTIRSGLLKADLHGPEHRQLECSGFFYLNGARYGVTFTDEHGVATFLDLYLTEGDDQVVARMYLKYQGEDFPVGNLRFQFNAEHQVAAAVIQAVDKEQNLYSFMTRGDASRSDVILAHDSWNPNETIMPPESFITVPQLRDVVTQWVTQDKLPPPAVPWTAVSEVGWF